MKALLKKRKYTQFSDSASAVQKFYVSQSTVRLFRKNSESSLTNMHSSEEVTEITKASLGRPLMIGKVLHKQVQEYLHIHISKKR